MVKVLELFSGSHSVGKMCKEKGWEVISLDKDGDADINEDILNWNYKDMFKPGDFDYIHASPPCHTFSNLRRSWIGRKLKQFGDIVVTKEMLDNDMIDNGLPILRKTQEIIKYFNPKYYTIENPLGRMREYIDEKPYIVDYCKYGNFGYRKRTCIWTNVKGFIPKKCLKDCVNMDGNRHRSNIGGTTSLTLVEKYRIPPALIRDIFSHIEFNDNT